jgi:hypothetical protein
MDLQTLAKQEQYMLVEVPAARFHLQKFYSIIMGEKLSGKVCLTPKLQRYQHW